MDCIWSGSLVVFVVVYWGGCSSGICMATLTSLGSKNAYGMVSVPLLCKVK